MLNTKLRIEERGAKALMRNGYTLLNKNTPVLELEFRNQDYAVVHLTKVCNPEYAPLGVMDTVKNISGQALHYWWQGRALPWKRSNLRSVFAYQQVDKYESMVRAGAFSLSDQYWLRPQGEQLSWEDANYFTHPFSPDVGDLLYSFDKYDQKINWERFDVHSPDWTLGGNLRKCWRLKGNRRILQKGGSSPVNQEPFNEVIASKILAGLGVRHVDYTLATEKTAQRSCLCEDFITPDTELVTAFQMYNSLPQHSFQDVYGSLLQAVEYWQVPGCHQFLDQMLIVDFLLANEDRHLNNFGFIRNVETLKFIGCAPLFDQGNSLWFNYVDSCVGKEPLAKPFASLPKEQLDLVTSFDSFSMDKLADSEKIIKGVLKQNKLCSEQRAEQVFKGYVGRAICLQDRKE